MAGLVKPRALAAAPRATLGARRSGFACGAHSLAAAVGKLSLSRPAPAAKPLETVALHGRSGRKCMLTGKKANNGYIVTFSHKRIHKRQEVNLQYKWLFWAEKERFVRLRVSTKALKSVEKVGLEKMALSQGIELEKLRYRDASASRKAWLEENGTEQPGKMRKEKLAKNVGKPTYIPKWKQAKLDKMSAADKEAELARFSERWAWKN